MISIIIPVYNVGQYIEQCLQSVMKQQCDESVECILVDDCGTDNSLQLAEKLISDYRGDIKFNIVHHLRNRGLSAARNTGMDVASGDWLFFLDSDDWLFSDCLSSLVNVSRKYPESDVIISSMESDNKWVIKESIVGRPDIPDYTEDRLWIMNGVLSRPVVFPLSAWNKLYKRSFILQNKLQFLEGFIREDEIWSFHWSKYANHVAFNKEVTYHYRVNPQGIVYADQNYHSNEYYLGIIDHYLENITSLGKEIQIRFVSKILLNAYINLHNQPLELTRCKELFLKLSSQSDMKRKFGCWLFRNIPHRLMCKRPFFCNAKQYLFDCK